MELLLFALGMMFSVSLVVLRLALVEIIKIKSTQEDFLLRPKKDSAPDSLLWRGKPQRINCSSQKSAWATVSVLCFVSLHTILTNIHAANCSPNS
jgi:hypothetical protein